MDANYAKIFEILPHRYPFLLVDKVVDIVKDQQAIGIKNVTFNEQVFQGHFPKDPIFPGILIVEAMAQTAAVLSLYSFPQDLNAKGTKPSIYFMTIDNVNFRIPVRPGDTLRMKVLKVQSRGNVWKFSSEAFVDDQLVAEASFMAMIRLP